MKKLQANLGKLNELVAQGFQVVGTKLSFRQIPDAPPGSVTILSTVTLRKGAHVLVLESSDHDFFEHTSSLHNSRGPSGEHMLRPYADLNRYWSEMEHLCVDAQAKREKAYQRLANKEAILDF